MKFVLPIKIYEINFGNYFTNFNVRCHTIQISFQKKINVKYK